MSTLMDVHPSPTPMSEVEQEQVREQLERLLETSHFKNSRRYPALFRFIVEETLEGRGEFLKERLLGVQVFGRRADYDTAADPIVRVTIAEIRKRIAQYYHDEAHDAEMRIELLPGRYAPEFRPSHASAGQPPVALPVARTDRQTFVEGELPVLPPAEPGVRNEVPAVAPAAVAPSRRAVKRWIAVILSVMAGAALALGARPLLHWLRPSASEQLWAPIMAGSRPVMVIIPAGAGKTLYDSWSQPGGLTGNEALKTNPTFLDHEALGENVVFSDALAALRVGDLMAVQHREYRLRLSTATTLNDVREGPGVLIGGMDNVWTMRATAGLPFRFSGSDEEGYWIADAKNPGSRAWLLNLKMQYAAVTRDYAIIARVRNEQTGQPQMILAGIGMSGTAAAGEFLVDPAQAEALRRRIGAGFRDRDFEAVLSTDVVNGIAGSPKILAVTVW